MDWNNVKSIMFVCHGNICRSPMAECVMRDMLDKGEIYDVEVASSATSREEIGNGIYPPAIAELRRLGIPLLPHHAVQLTRSDLRKYDLFLGADSVNVMNMERILGSESVGRCYRLLDFSKSPRDIADPWWTGIFTETSRDILEGCTAILELLKTAREKKS